VLFFFFGSFSSSFLIEIAIKRNAKNVFILPVVTESVILILIAIFGNDLINTHPNTIAFGLLFVMGLQNSLVTRISNETVRTRHLTGLFTDLGIELSQLFFYKTQPQILKLNSNIRLRLRIICFFFTGGILGGVFYEKLKLSVL